MLAVHVIDETLNDFLAFYNPLARQIRESTGFLPLPVFSTQLWLFGLLGAVVVLLLLSPLVFPPTHRNSTLAHRLSSTILGDSLRDLLVHEGALMSWLWYLLILLLLLLFAYAIYRMFFVRAAGVIPSVGINVVGIDITPTQLPCDGKSKFTAVVTASGWSDDGVSRNVEIKLFDDETWPDELDKDPKGTATIGIKFSSPLPSNKPYPWTLSHTMTGLYCDTDCYVKGPSGSSDESDPKVYAQVTVLHGNPMPKKKSSSQTIKCVKG